MRYTFGPIASRRFGLSLGIDLSPDKKSCNFDCLYCELKAAKPVDKQENPPTVLEIINEVKEALERFKDIDVITITSNGEPTLYPYLDELVEKLNLIKNDKKLLILSNGAKITEKAIQKTLKKIDIVKLSLDCASYRCFKKIDRPVKGIEVEKIIEGMQEFRKDYLGFFVIEILVIKGINDTKEEFKTINKALQRIKPDRVDIGSIDRPPAYDVQGVNYQRLYELSKEIKALPVVIVSRNRTQKHFEDLSKEEILNLLAHRPLTQEDIKTVFSKKSQDIFKELLEKKVIIKKRVGSVDFYKKA